MQRKQRHFCGAGDTVEDPNLIFLNEKERKTYHGRYGARIEHDPATVWEFFCFGCALQTASDGNPNHQPSAYHNLHSFSFTML